MTVNEGIKVHRTDCKNAVSLRSNFSYRILAAKWIDSTQHEFRTTIQIIGIDNLYRGKIKQLKEACGDLWGDLKFIEADLTNIWEWREKHKHTFQRREGEKLTFTPLFITAVIKALKDFPVYKKVDTCAAEFKSFTPYMYSTYQRNFSLNTECEAEPSKKNKIIILGGGPNRIGPVSYTHLRAHET